MEDVHSTVVQIPPSWLFRHELLHYLIEGLLDTFTIKAFGDFWEVEFNHITCPPTHYHRASPAPPPHTLTLSLAPASPL